MNQLARIVEHVEGAFGAFEHDVVQEWKDAGVFDLSRTEVLRLINYHMVEAEITRFG